MPVTVRIAQYGTKHGHAAGKLTSLRTNPQVELAGVFEPDLERRAELRSAGGPWADLIWYDGVNDLLGDPTTVAVASEGRNDESLAQTEQIVRAGKHVWYDKPAGDDLEHWRRVMALAEQQQVIIQMGYMFRYHAGFSQIADWVHAGLLGQVYSVKAHMSTWISESARRVIAIHQGGIFYDLAGHMLDQVVWLLGRPDGVSAFLHQDDPAAPGFANNTLAVFSYPRAWASISIAAHEPSPTARRFEVYGDRGSAILDSFEPIGSLRLCLTEAAGGFTKGEQLVPVQDVSRQALYDRELMAFLKVIAGRQPPERPAAHDLVVQETLLRATRR
jgi:predicted dehydrogenase